MGALRLRLRIAPAPGAYGSSLGNSMRKSAADPSIRIGTHRGGRSSVHSYGEADGIHHYIAQELVGDGHNLGNVLAELREKNSIPEGYYREAAEFIQSIARAMQSAHDTGVIHRDLKPQNILIDEEGQPKITDFGLARITGEESLSGPYGTARDLQLHEPRAGHGQEHSD